MMEQFFQTFIQAMKWIFPAYVANAAPVLFGGGKAIDMGIELPDGNHLLGKGKTIKGSLAGVIAGSIMGVLTGIYLLGFLLALGAVLGDLAGSFLKRRIGLKRGQPFWLLDQFDFVVGALLLTALLEIPSWRILITILAVTPALHIITNFIAYKLEIKSVPW